MATADGRVAQTLADLLVRRTGQGDSSIELLVAALDGAVALAEVDDVAVVVGQDLHLDVPGLDDELLDVDAAVAEGGLGLGLGGVEAGAQGDVVVGDAHAASAAAGGGLDEDRVADLVGELQRLVPRCRRRPSEPGTVGTLAFLASLRASILSPSSRMASTPGPMNSILQSRQISAKWAFSARKP